MALAVVLTFWSITLRTGWNRGSVSSLGSQGDWGWHVTAALGGVVSQEFAVVKANGMNDGG